MAAGRLPVPRLWGLTPLRTRSLQASGTARRAFDEPRDGKARSDGREVRARGVSPPDGRFPSRGVPATSEHLAT